MSTRATPPTAAKRRASKRASRRGAGVTDRRSLTRLLDFLGEDNIMWGSDFPHPDGVWPASQHFIDDELGHFPEEIRYKVICDNAVKLYGFAA